MIIKSFVDTDFECLYALCADNPLYYQHLNETLSKAYLQHHLTALPTDALPENKHNLMIWQEQQLVAFLEMIYHYPEQNSVLIGFFIVNKQMQNQGVGTKIIQNLIQKLKQEGMKILILSSVVGNPQSSAFWLKNGFIACDEIEAYDDIALQTYELHLTE